MSYKNITLGDVKSVDLDLNKTNILDLEIADQFTKTCSSDQSFIIVNEETKVFKLILTGGTLATSVFKHSTKEVVVTEEGGSLSDYDGTSINRLYICVETIESLIKLTIIINVE